MLEVKPGLKLELAENQDFWKDDISGVFLRKPGKTKLSRPTDVDYRTQLEWFTSKRLQDPSKVLFKDDPGETWFEVSKDMDVTRIKIAVSKGILVSKGTAKIRAEQKEKKNLFRTDRTTGTLIYDGPNKLLYQLLQKNNEKELIDAIFKMRDFSNLEILLNMEQKGWNPASSPRMLVIEAIEKQIKTQSRGVGIIKEEEVETSTLEEEIKKSKKEMNRK